MSRVQTISLLIGFFSILVSVGTYQTDTQNAEKSELQAELFPQLELFAEDTQKMAAQECNGYDTERKKVQGDIDRESGGELDIAIALTFDEDEWKKRLPNEYYICYLLEDINSINAWFAKDDRRTKRSDRLGLSSFFSGSPEDYAKKLDLIHSQLSKEKKVEYPAFGAGFYSNSGKIHRLGRRVAVLNKLSSDDDLFQELNWLSPLLLTIAGGAAFASRGRRKSRIKKAGG